MYLSNLPQALGRLELTYFLRLPVYLPYQEPLRGFPPRCNRR